MASLSPDQSPELTPFQEVHTLLALAAEHVSAEKLAQSFDLPLTKGFDWCKEPSPPSVLDAIAALCVTPAHPQSVAVAVVIDTQPRQVRLIMCQGGVESPDKQLLAHVRKTWRLLRGISKQKGNGLEERLFGYLYRFQKDEIIRTFREWWPVLDLAVRQFGRLQRGVGSTAVGHPYFVRATLALRKVSRILCEDRAQPTAEEWEQLLALMHTAAEQTRAIDPSWLRAVASPVDGAWRCPLRSPQSIC